MPEDILTGGGNSPTSSNFDYEFNRWCLKILGKIIFPGDPDYENQKSAFIRSLSGNQTDTFQYDKIKAPDSLTRGLSFTGSEGAGGNGDKPGSGSGNDKLKWYLNPSTAGGWSNTGTAADVAKGFFFGNLSANDSSLTSGINQAYNSVANGLMAFSPVGTIIGGAMKVGAFVGDAMQAIGGGTDLMTTTDLLMNSSLFSWNVGAINGFTGSSTQKFSADNNTIERVGSSYGGTTKDIMNAADHANKKFGLFSQGSKNKWNNRINTARQLQSMMADIANNAYDQLSMLSDANYLNYSYNMAGGYDLRYMRAAKEGAKLDIAIDWTSLLSYNDEIDWKQIFKDGGIIEESTDLIDWAELFKQGGSIELQEEVEESIDWIMLMDDSIDWTQILKNGGKLESEEQEELQIDTTLKNVIPEGALHKNKHHIENTDEFTLKGIPVIDVDGNQQAEIECNEIIFTLEVTKKLEGWYHEFYNDDTSDSRKNELAILAGKLLVEQILYNTDDRTGLIDTLKLGGNIPIINKEIKNNNITQDQITEMVKQALLNLLSK